MRNEIRIDIQTRSITMQAFVIVEAPTPKEALALLRRALCDVHTTRLHVVDPTKEG